MLSLQATSHEMIRLKAAELRSRMWCVAALSGAVGAIPIPGFSIVFDGSLLMNEARFYYAQLGLDEASLKRYAKLTSTDYQQLQSIVDNSCSWKLSEGQGLKNMVQLLSSYASAAALEEGSRFIPVIGCFIASQLSFGGTYYALKCVLDNTESAALKVVKFGAKCAADAEESDDD